MYYKLFIPGPIAVSPKTYQAMAKPLVGHRSPDFVQLYQKMQPKLQALYYTKDPVYISTSSSWGVMESAVRNLCRKKVLNCMSGAFSDKWHEVSLRCGLDAGKLQYEWGTAVKPEDVRKALQTGEYDAITLIHNETSTGTMNPLAEIMAVVREFPEVMSIVDTVSSFTVQAIEKDNLGIDVILAGSQKALALPPGIALFSVSQRALKKAETISGRGYYFDFLEFHKNHEKGMTPSTPNISLIYGLEAKLDDIFEEGLENRYARHKRLNHAVRDWVKRNGFELFPEDEKYGSIGLNCIKNIREIDIVALNKALKERYQCVIDTGYGKLKGKAFRISNMGDETDETIDTLLSQIEGLIHEFVAVR